MKKKVFNSVNFLHCFHGDVKLKMFSSNRSEDISFPPYAGNILKSNIPYAGNILKSNVPYAGNILKSNVPYAGNMLKSNVPYAGNILMSNVPFLKWESL